MNNQLFRQIKHYGCLPFRNLTTSQRVLQYLRLGTSLLTVIFVVILLQVNNQSTKAYVAKINCAHIDVAYGLYNSLRNSISDSYADADYSNGYLPSDLSLTVSEISILTEYTQQKVSDAPQSILLGVSSWCKVDYKTKYQNAPHTNHHEANFTTTCFGYEGSSLFDYRWLLSNNGLTIILAYAYESDYDDDTSYVKRVVSRTQKFRILKIVTIVQLVLQLLVFISTLVVYGNRGTEKDLSRIPSLFLNLVALTSMAAGVSMIAAFSLVFQEINGTMKEISSGMASFGINMRTGKTFFTAAWLALAFSCLSMISWIGPLWCSNPPEENYLHEDEMYANHHDISTLSDQDEHFVARPYQVSRQTRKKNLRRVHSRLFDDVPDHDDSDHEGLLDKEDPDYESYRDEVTPQVLELSSRVHSEWELRKLGEKMARKLSTRQLNRRKKVLDILPEKEETKNLLYSDLAFSNHQYPQELPKLSTGDLSKTQSLSKQVRKISDPVLRTRNLLEMDRNDPIRKLPSSTNPFRDSINSEGASFLDEQEMNYLDNTNFINRIN
ncbi:CIC11C00000000082 [Sungouiella intermedia]|uniref:CIC11C00000000082 n=1 Tax=Sungouiella intermedia TaxID=45354 RepID=A0A1L0DAQ6_9ASCO|nr:CIC11C00000000082 [[Candida] intermedia]